MKWTLSVAVVGVLGLAVGLLVLDHYAVGVFHDDAMYVILARSIATGQGYRYLNLPGTPVASHFPPGYPLLLALLWRVAPEFPQNVVLFKAVNALLVAASATLVAQLVRERLDSRAWGLTLGVATAVSIPVLILAAMVLSEPLFLALALLTLLLGERLLEQGASPRRALVIGLLIGAATLVRAQGVVLAVALVIALMRRDRRREAAVAAAGTLALLVPWQLYLMLSDTAVAAPLAGNYGSYASWWVRGLHDMGARMIPLTLAHTVPETTAILVTLLSPFRSAAGRLVIVLALGVLLAAGGVTLARRAPLTALFLAGYAAIVILWPFPPARFIWGVWPLVLFLVAAGGWSSTQRDVWPTPFRAALATSFALLVLGHVIYEARAVAGQWWQSIPREQSLRIETVVDWTRRNTSPGDLVAADDEGAVFLYTGRKSIPVMAFTTAHYLESRSAATEANDGLAPLIARYPIGVVLVNGRRTLDAAQYLVSKSPPLLVPRDSFPGGAAFTVLKR